MLRENLDKWDLENIALGEAKGFDKGEALGKGKKSRGDTGLP